MVILAMAIAGAATACSAILGIKDVPPEGAGVDEAGSASTGAEDAASNAGGGRSDAKGSPTGDDVATGPSDDGAGPTQGTDAGANQGTDAGFQRGTGGNGIDAGSAADAAFNCSDPGFSRMRRRQSTTEAARWAAPATSTAGSTCPPTRRK